jgi:L-iditol 2-dehydrogenase
LKCGSGHESAGEVAEVGEGVTQWKIGTTIRSVCLLCALIIRQAIEWLLKLAYRAPSHLATRAEQEDTMVAPMWSSSLLRHSTVRGGHHILCAGTTDASTGTLTRWHLHPAQWLHRLPDDVSLEEGALCEPLAVALAGIERADLRLGDPVLIWYA